MNIQSELKKEGIIEKSQIDILISNSIAKTTARKIFETFPDYGLSEKEIFNKLSQLNMYRASMTNGLAEASYFYKNSSIYFNENIEIEDLYEFAIHECIHSLQEIKNEKNELKKMGLCDYTNGINRPIGLALNEAAVQFMASTIIGIHPDFEKYYGITLFTPSPSYYAIECALINQISYFTGTDVLFKSTLLSDNSFKEKFIEKTSEKFFYEIQSSFDKILKYEDHLIKINNKISLLEDGSNKFLKLTNSANKYKEKLVHEFFKAQNSIVKNFFDNEFNKIENLEQLDIFRRKLYKFTDILGNTPNYKFFDNYYVETMNKLEHKCNILENGGIETFPSIKKTNIFAKLLKKLFKNSYKEFNTL